MNEKIQLNNIEDRAQETLYNLLGKIPPLRVISINKEKNNIDLTFTLDVDGKKTVLLVEVKSAGQPRIAREAINQLIRYRNNYPNSYCIFMAPFVSPKSAEICKKDNIGYLDFAGNGYLSFNSVYIEHGGKPNPFTEKRDLVSLFSPKSSRVLRVLMNHPGRNWKTQEIANEAGVSLGHVQNVKKRLLDNEWTIKQDGFSLTEPWSLLEEWANFYTYRKNLVQNFYSLKSVSEIESDLGRVCRENNIEYALTGFSGAARLAPAVRYTRVMAYLNNKEEEVVSLLSLKKVESGANVTLLEPYDEGVFYNTQVIEDIRVVSPVQIYLDLKGFKGRGEEAAEVLLRDVLKTKWANVKK